MTGTLAITGDTAADDLLNTSGLALLIGMLLDQQVPMEWAFKGPSTLRQRLDATNLSRGRLDARKIAAMDPAELEAIFKDKPALHRYPGSMAKRTQALCQFLVDNYKGRAEAVWADADTGATLFARLRALPGYGDEKAKIFMAILAKRFGVAPAGWQKVAAPFSDRTPRSVADIDSPDSARRVREFKAAMKAKGKGKTG